MMMMTCAWVLYLVAYILWSQLCAGLAGHSNLVVLYERGSGGGGSRPNKREKALPSKNV